MQPRDFYPASKKPRTRVAPSSNFQVQFQKMAAETNGPTNGMANGVGNTPPSNSSIFEELIDRPLNQEMLQFFMAVLRKNGMQETEDALAKDAAQILRQGEVAQAPIIPMNESLMAEFDMIVQQVDNSFDFFQAEFSLLVFPLFAHCYLKLLENPNPHLARDFFEKYWRRIPSAYEEQVEELRKITNSVQIQTNPFVQLLLKNPFNVRMSRSCIKQLEVSLARTPTIKTIIKDRINIDNTETISKLKSSVECQMGGLLGQVMRSQTRHKMFFCVAKDDVAQAIEKRKYKGKDPKDIKKLSNVAPMPDRIPLPGITPLYKEEKLNWQKDVNKMTMVSQDCPPSVCMYTALNAHGGVTCSDVSDDTSILALGYGDSQINLFALDESQKLRRLRDANQLEDIDTDCDNINEVLYDESSASTNVILTGHGGPVYSVSFSPEKRLLVSSSRDNTIRLWSLDTQKNVVVYRTSMPIWQVQFCNRGYYFCSGGADKTAALWCTDRMHPLRVFPDSYGQVSCVDFHGNCNYIVGGSDDRYIRIWDVLSGTCVRTFCGHKAGVRAVKVSPDGRYVASVGGDGTVCLWDVGLHRLLGMETRSVPATMGSISFSRDGGAFATSYGGNNVSIYSLDNLISATANQSEYAFDPKINMPGYNIFSYPTKQTPVIGLHFTRRNLLMAVGAFNQ